MVNPYDKSTRFAAKMDAAGFLHWLLYEPSGLAFREWLDTRTIPFPGERDRTCDTVARLDGAGRQAEPVACIVEFLSRRQADVLDGWPSTQSGCAASCVTGAVGVAGSR